MTNHGSEHLAQRMQDEPGGEPEHEAAIAHFRHGLELYRRGDVPSALVEWKKGRDLEPDNWVIRKQIWAVENPERFYDGAVDFAWQREKRERGE